MMDYEPKCGEFGERSKEEATLLELHCLNLP